MKILKSFFTTLLLSVFIFPFYCSIESEAQNSSRSNRGGVGNGIYAKRRAILKSTSSAKSLRPRLQLGNGFTNAYDKRYSKVRLLEREYQMQLIAWRQHVVELKERAKRDTIYRTREFRIKREQAKWAFLAELEQKKNQMLAFSKKQKARAHTIAKQVPSQQQISKASEGQNASSEKKKSSIIPWFNKSNSSAKAKRQKTRPEHAKEALKKKPKQETAASPMDNELFSKDPSAKKRTSSKKSKNKQEANKKRISQSKNENSPTPSESIWSRIRRGLF